MLKCLFNAIPNHSNSCNDLIEKPHTIRNETKTRGKDDKMGQAKICLVSSIFHTLTRYRQPMWEEKDHHTFLAEDGCEKGCYHGAQEVPNMEHSFSNGLPQTPTAPKILKDNLWEVNIFNQKLTASQCWENWISTH